MTDINIDNPIVNENEELDGAEEEFEIPEDVKKMTYEEALAELKQINNHIERGIDMSEISENVKRSKALFLYCKQYLKNLELVIEEIEKIDFDKKDPK